MVSAKDKILETLRKNVGKYVESNKLASICNSLSWQRQTRLLRQEGYDIEYSAKKKAYILHSLKKKRGKKRVPINQKQRYRILERNGYHCVKCGRGVEDGVKLEVDHKIPVDYAAKKHYENGDLQTLCNECNQGKKNYYRDFSKKEIRIIASLKSGVERIEALFKVRANKPISCEVLEAISRIRDWERTLRYLRKTKKMRIIWDRDNNSYIYMQ